MEKRKQRTVPLSIVTQRSIILSIIGDFIEENTPDRLFDFIVHVGFDIDAIQSMDQFPAAWLAQYRLRNGSYDVDRACLDLATWPPIAARIRSLQLEKTGD